MQKLVAACFFILACQLALANSGVQERKQWQQYFNTFDAVGTMVVLDNRSGLNQLLVFNKKRAEQRFSPASTFKIPHTLFALDAKLVKDEFQIFPWDGVIRSYQPHNQDQTLRSAMRYSAVWVYQGFAKQLGEAKAHHYLKKTHYGNQNPASEKQPYWVEGELAVSAFEQVKFLQKLYQNALPFSENHQRLVKDIMLLEAKPNWRLRAKTGWQGHYGWWVGWVEWPEGPVFFALNIDTPNRMDDLYKREAVAKAVLVAIKALPESKAP